MSRIDATFSLLRHGYEMLGSLRARHGDVVPLRMLGVPMIAVGGPSGAELFYDPDRMQRGGALPKAVQRTLFGVGGVQTLDGPAHAARKELFRATLCHDGVRAVADAFADELTRAAAGWGRRGEVVLLDEAAVALLRAIAPWVGVPLDDEDVRTRAASLVAMVDGFGSFGPRHLQARVDRFRSELWIEDLVRRVRGGRTRIDPASPLQAFLDHRDHEGQPLEDRMVAIELLNVIRPTVAVCWYVAFAAHALHEQPGWRERLRQRDDPETVRFVHELRRFYPFAPFLGARAARDFRFAGRRFPKGRLVLLDIYGTDHDRRLWAEPERFDPDRFVGREPGTYDFLPQGGGDAGHGHRCPGERLTIELLQVASVFLASGVRYEVPPQRLDIPLRRFPTRPGEGVRIGDVRVLQPIG